MSPKGRGQNYETKFVILYPVNNYFPIVTHSTFQFYTGLTTDKYNKIYTYDSPEVGVVSVP